MAIMRLMMILIQWPFTLLIFLVIFSYANASSSSSSSLKFNEDAIRSFLSRILSPSAAASFEFESCLPSSLSPTSDSKNSDLNLGGTALTSTTDAFELVAGSQPGKVLVRGSSTSALTAGIGWYLRYGANVTLEWGDENNKNRRKCLQAPLPGISSQIVGRTESPVIWRYYMNVCTLGYSTAFWQWDRWEQELDWMAFRGINLPLAYVGQELIWERVFGRAGLNISQLDDFFAGPAFLPWQRMGNMKRFGGPLPSSWKKKTTALQKRILDRMRDLGMTPVLPAFAGFVPNAMGDLGHNIIKSANWCSFPLEDCCVGLLNASDPLFPKLGQWFIEEMRSEWGQVDGVYGADTFNEMRPPSGDTKDLQKWGSAVHEGIQRGDPNGTWLLQGWIFYSEQDFWTNERIDAYLSGAGRTLVLDLFTDHKPEWERSGNFANRPWIWNMLENFGGRRDMHGNLTRIATGPIEDLTASNHHMVGIGATPEAIENNLIMFDLLYEMGWRKESPNVKTWVHQYATRRYGWPLHESAAKAWDILRQYAYSEYRPYHNPMECKPTLQSLEHCSGDRLSCPANNSALVTTWWLLADVADDDPHNEPLLYDLVDVGRQVLVNYFGILHAQLIEHSQKCPQSPSYCASVSGISFQMVRVTIDLDNLMASNKNFLLGRWVASAESWADHESEARQYVFNAKNQITWWGPNENIHDYASKPWAGLIGTYYKSRWKAFLAEIARAARAQGVPNITAATEAATNTEILWLEKEQAFPTEPIGDTIAITKMLLQRYGKIDVISEIRPQ